MRAMILAAGLGTRLRPLTADRPKALVEISGRTLLEITLSRLRSFGVTEVIINVYHFADMVIDYLQSKNNFGVRIEISSEDALLDTGGGLKKAAWFFLEDHTRLDEPFLLHNVDVLSTIDFARMLQFHTEQHALATLAVQSRQSSRLLLFDDHHQLRSRRAAGADTVIPPALSAAKGSEAIEDSGPAGRNLLLHRQGMASAVPRSADNKALAPEGHSEPLPLAFSGIHIISPRLLPMLTEEGVFSIIDSYVRLAAQGQKILAFRADQYYWRDLGKPADLAQAAQEIKGLSPI
jgi:NDP-sugar pyrophosphorylase family protein